MFFVAVLRRAGVVKDCLRVSYDLRWSAAPFPRDHLLPRIAADLATSVPQLVSANDIAGKLNLTLIMLQLML